MRRLVLAALVTGCVLLPVGSALAEDDQGTPPASETVTTEPSEPMPSVGEADLDTMPTGPGEPSEPMPTGSQPDENQMAPTLEGGAIYGACAEQGPLISGQLLVRLNLAVNVGSAVVNLRVEAENARVKEIELPYHGWVVTYDEDRALAKGPERAKDSFWFWVALDRIDDGAERIIVKSYGETADGRTIAHDVVDGANTPGRHAATLIPLNEDFKPVELPRDPAAPADAPDAPRETPVGGRTPCMVDGPFEKAGNGPFGGIAGILLGGGVGALVGAASIILLRRRRG